MLRRAARAVKLLATDGRIPRPLRGAAAAQAEQQEADYEWTRRHEPSSDSGGDGPGKVTVF